MTNPIELQEVSEEAPAVGPKPDGCLSGFSISVTGAGT